MFPAHVFREYDVRGIASQDFHSDFADKLGRAYANILPEDSSRVVAVGRDVRQSGVALQQELMASLVESGCHVLDLGMVPTPICYFAVHHLGADGCIMVTASHNPSEYNGFKIMLGKESFYGKDLQALYQRMLQPFDKTYEKGTLKAIDLLPVYQKYVSDSIQLDKPIKVVIDAGNGPSGIIAAPLYRQLGCDVIELYCDPDGTFPNHHPDPTIEKNLTDLKASVLENGADLGIAFDGDGDRVGVVDEHGEVIWGDMLVTIYARTLLKKQPGATVISEVKCSQRMYDDIRQKGGNAIMWRTGHSPIKAKMKETGALLAGEMSGHMFFADRFYGFDDAVYAGIRLMEIMSQTDTPLSAMLLDLPSAVATPEIRMDCDDSIKFQIVSQATKYFQGEGYDVIDVDGVRVNFDEGWGLIRASNTQPSLVLRFEASTPEYLNQYRGIMESWLNQHLN